MFYNVKSIQNLDGNIIAAAIAIQARIHSSSKHLKKAAIPLSADTPQLELFRQCCNSTPSQIPRQTGPNSKSVISTGGTLHRFQTIVTILSATELLAGFNGASPRRRDECD
jgi:hypothetical protein